MFVLAGTRTVLIKKLIDPKLKCSTCQHTDPLVEITQTYFHVFYIPLFPVTHKEMRVTCRECGYNICQPLSRKYKGIVRTPLWFFSGLGGYRITFAVPDNLRREE